MTTTATITELGCCGRRTDLQGLAAQADMHPVTTRAGRRARAALALAIVERAAMARGNGSLAAQARRGLQGLGTVQTPAQVAATVADLQSRATAAAARVSPQFRSYLGLARAVAALAGLAVSGDPNAARITAWLGWVFGGPLPSDVAENDIRILNSVFGFQPAMSALISAAPALDSSMSVDARAAFEVIANTYLPALKAGITAAYAALPAPATPPPAPPPPEQQVSAVNQTLTLNPSILRNVIRNPLRPGVITALKPVKAETSPFLVALPAAAVLWYLFK